MNYCRAFDPHARIFISANNISTNNSIDEDPSIRIESSAIIHLRGVSTKLNKYIVFTMQRTKNLTCCKCNNTAKVVTS